MMTTATRLVLACGAVFGTLVACAGSSGDGVTSSSGGAGASGLPCDAAAATACGGQKCDAALGCVECLANADCAVGKPFCTRGRCGECETNVHCPAAKPACWPSDRECHVACRSNDDCKSGEQRICDVGTGQCIGCRAASDCSARTPICDATSRRCVACAVDTDCGVGATSHCDTARGSCVACVTAAHCQAPTAICNDSRCVECKDDKDCPAATPKCKDRRCEAD